MFKGGTVHTRHLSLVADFRVCGGRRAGAQSYSLGRQVKATRPGHMLPQTQVSRGRSFHHQSPVCDEVGKGHLPGAEQKLHAVPFSLMLAVWSNFTVCFCL